MKVYLEPTFGPKPDPGDGGVRRVVEALQRHLPEHGVEFVINPEQADLVHIHIAPLSGTERYLQNHPDIPYILSSHGYYWLEYEWKEWSLKANDMCIAALRLADHTIAPSEWVAQTIRRNSLRPTTPLPHGIEPEDWSEVLPKQNYVLWNKTRIDPICDPQPVVTLAERMPGIQFVSTYGKVLPNLRLTKRLPYIEALQLVREAGIYLCTARETFGIGTLEAMAAGVPIVGWNWGGQREFVEHKVTGWLATPGDYDSLEEGIQYCLQHRDEIGKAGREVALGKFLWKDIVGQYYDLYKSVIEQKFRSGPRVSIIVPAYGLEDHLPEALDSVLAQSYQDWECVIIDDASPDKCGEIADEYAARDDRFRVIHNKENQYLAGALNTGIEKSRGKYILPLDADNMLPLNTLKILADSLATDRTRHIAYGNVEFLDPDGKRWHSGWPPEFRTEWQIKRNPTSERASNLIPSGSMFRKEVWELTGGYRRRWKTAEDADFWTRATSYGFRAEMATKADVLVYRNREDSMSRDEKTLDWSTWYPWARDLSAPPAAIDYEERVAIPSYEPILITVVIPVGPGHEQLVIDAVDSIDAQTFRLWECIVVNDSGNPLPNLPNWVKIINNTPARQGVAASRNIGLRQAKASLFLPLDADDTLEPTALAMMHEVWLEHRDYVYSDWYERWTDHSNIWECADYDAKNLTKKGCIHTVTALYPLSAWKDIGGFDESLFAWEDWDFQLQLAKRGICGIRIPEPLLTYRKDTGMRREENYTDFEQSKQGIVDKWGPYFTGEEELMACSSCRKKSIPKQSQVQASESPQRKAQTTSENGNDLVLMEYVGGKEGSLNYRGPSGQIYRFGSMTGENQRLVRPNDVDHFLTMRDFRVIQKEAPVGTNS